MRVVIGAAQWGLEGDSEVWRAVATIGGESDLKEDRLRWHRRSGDNGFCQYQLTSTQVDLLNRSSQERSYILRGESYGN